MRQIVNLKLKAFNGRIARIGGVRAHPAWLVDEDLQVSVIRRVDRKICSQWVIKELGFNSSLYGIHVFRTKCRQTWLRRENALRETTNFKALAVGTVEHHVARKRVADTHHRRTFRDRVIHGLEWNDAIPKSAIFYWTVWVETREWQPSERHFLNVLIRQVVSIFLRIAYARCRRELLGKIESCLSKNRLTRIIEVAATLYRYRSEIYRIKVFSILLKGVYTQYPTQPVLHRATRQLQFNRQLVLLKSIEVVRYRVDHDRQSRHSRLAIILNITVAIARKLPI